MFSSFSFFCILGVFVLSLQKGLGVIKKVDWNHFPFSWDLHFPSSHKTSASGIFEKKCLGGVGNIKGLMAGERKFSEHPIGLKGIVCRQDQGKRVSSSFRNGQQKLGHQMVSFSLSTCVINIKCLRANRRMGNQTNRDKTDRQRDGQR